VALALGTLVCFVVYRSLQTRTDTNNGVDVILAANDMRVGVKLAEQDVRMARIPASVAPPNAFHWASNIIGWGVILPTQKGELILPSKLDPLHSRLGDFRLILAHHPSFLHPAAALRTLPRHGHINHFVYLFGNFPAAPLTVRLTRFPTRLLGMSLGRATRERCRLPLART
jgi:SAF domain